MAVPLRKLTARLERTVVDRLEDLDVQLLRLRGVKRHAQGHEGVCESLHTDADGAVAHVRGPGLLDGVVVHIDDLVEIVRNNLGDVVQLLEVVHAVLNEGGQRERGKVAHGGLFGRRVFDDFGTEIGGLDGAEVLLVGLA